MKELNTKELVSLYYKIKRKQLINKQECFPVIKLAKPVSEDAYLDTGMKANLIDVSLDGTYDGEEVYSLLFEWKDYFEYNKSKEQANYYDSNGDACLTASEAGWCPKDFKEEIYSGVNDGTQFFIIEDNEDYLYQLDKDTRNMVIESLKTQIGILETRVRVAETSSLKESKSMASRDEAELKIALKALKQLT